MYFIIKVIIFRFKTMSIYFELDFAESLLLGGGLNVKKKHFEMSMCHEFALLGVDELKNDDRVGLLPGKLVKKNILYGPASKMDKTVIYPCNRYRCQIPCPCSICLKKPRPACFCPPDSADCNNSQYPRSRNQLRLRKIHH